MKKLSDYNADENKVAYIVVNNNNKEKLKEILDSSK